MRCCPAISGSPGGFRPGTAELPTPLPSYGNEIGHYWAGVVISLPVIAGLAWLRRWREIALLVAILLVRALNSSIKELIDSPRPTPDLIRVTEEAHGLGFPSGHASGTVLLFGALILVGDRLSLPGAVRVGSWVVGLGTILATGFGRVYAGAHWPSDVVGGWLLGFAILLTLSAILGLRLPLAEPMRRPPDAMSESNTGWRIDRIIPPIGRATPALPVDGRSGAVRSRPCDSSVRSFASRCRCRA